MTTNRDQETAEDLPQLADRFLTRTAFGVLCMALAYGSGAAQFLANQELSAWLDRMQLVLSLAAVAIVLPEFIRFVRLKAGGRCQPDPEGFVADIFKRASVTAFSATFCTMVIIDPLARNALSAWPPGLFVNAILFVSLAVFGVTFLVLNREDPADDDGSQ